VIRHPWSISSSESRKAVPTASDSASMYPGTGSLGRLRIRYADGKEIRFPDIGVVEESLSEISNNIFVSSSPHGRTSSQHLRKEMEAKWNKLVDDYIHQGQDSRSGG
jgi:hypothetical protein